MSARLPASAPPTDPGPRHSDSANVVTVPVYARDIKRGTLAEAGISQDEFLEALK